MSILLVNNKYHMQVSEDFVVLITDCFDTQKQQQQQQQCMYVFPVLVDPYMATALLTIDQKYKNLASSGVRLFGVYKLL